MSTTIYYFSGTGNSLQVAKDLSERLDAAEIVSIPTVIDGEVAPASDSVGFVFPVYAYGLPLLVARFIAKMMIARTNTYFFAVATCRAEKGGAILQTANALKAKGLKLSAGFAVYMPGNAIHTYEADSADTQADKFRLWEKRAEEIASVIRNQAENMEQLTFSQRVWQGAIIYPIASRTFHKRDKQFWIDDNCNGCGICQRICPVSNIAMQDKKPVWLHQCEQCLTCLNWCPKVSIQYAKATVGRKRYHHPHVHLKDLIIE